MKWRPILKGGSADQAHWFGTMTCCSERDRPPQRTEVFKKTILVASNDDQPQGRRENSGAIAFLTGMHGF
jgi:hypothetical protein